MIKIEVNKTDKIEVSSTVDGKALDIVSEMYAMFKHLEKHYPHELTIAVMLLSKRQEGENG